MVPIFKLHIQACIFDSIPSGYWSWSKHSSSFVTSEACMFTRMRHCVPESFAHHAPMQIIEPGIESGVTRTRKWKSYSPICNNQPHSKSNKKRNKAQQIHLVPTAGKPRLHALPYAFVLMPFNLHNSQQKFSGEKLFLRKNERRFTLFEDFETQKCPNNAIPWACCFQTRCCFHEQERTRWLTEREKEHTSYTSSKTRTTTHASNAHSQGDGASHLARVEPVASLRYGKKLKIRIYANSNKKHCWRKNKWLELPTWIKWPDCVLRALSETLCRWRKGGAITFVTWSDRILLAELWSRNLNFRLRAYKFFLLRNDLVHWKLKTIVKFVPLAFPINCLWNRNPNSRLRLHHQKCFASAIQNRLGSGSTALLVGEASKTN